MLGLKAVFRTIAAFICCWHISALANSCKEAVDAALGAVTSNNIEEADRQYAACVVEDDRVKGVNTMRQRSGLYRYPAWPSLLRNGGGFYSAYVDGQHLTLQVRDDQEALREFQKTLEEGQPDKFDVTNVRTYPRIFSRHDKTYQEIVYVGQSRNEIVCESQESYDDRVRSQLRYGYAGPPQKPVCPSIN